MTSESADSDQLTVADNMPRQSQRSVSHVGHLSHAAAGRRRVGHRCEELIALAPCALHTATHSRSVPFPPVTSEPCHNPAIPRSVTRAAHAHQLAHQLAHQPAHQPAHRSAHNPSPWSHHRRPMSQAPPSQRPTITRPWGTPRCEHVAPHGPWGQPPRTML